MAELLFELGCEELPASFVERAYQQLEQEIVSRLDEALLSHGSSLSLGTPRRLIIKVEDVLDRQPDQVKEMRGPAIKSAFDDAGNPLPPLLGFLKGQGAAVDDVRKEGDYVWVSKKIEGKPTAELLQEILPAAVRAMTFDKSMRWGQARMRFARPIRWMTALLGGAVVSFDIEGVQSGSKSRGHRFNFPDEFEVKSYDQLLAELRQRNVEPDPAIRRSRIIKGAQAAASGSPEMTEDLIDENVFLSEWPEALEGEFRPEFQSLPEPVLVTAMAKHERFFPVRGTDGKLMNRFISIRGGGDEAVVRNGNAWVLNARFNDAKFFYDEDAKLTMDQFLEKTKLMTFQEKLGSVRDRSNRLAALAPMVLSAAGNPNGASAAKAALYAKADLSSGLVSELSSLQGIVGSEYARREGWDESAAFALGAHYDTGRIGKVDSEAKQTAMAVLIADQIDKLAGYLGLGLVPTGSSDPYGLRRAVTMLIEASQQWPEFKSDFDSLLQSGLDLYAKGGNQLDHAAAHDALKDIFVGRYTALWDDVKYDHLEAALRADDPQLVTDPKGVRFRCAVMAEAAGDTDLVQAATRPLNIVAAAAKKSIAFDASKGFDGGWESPTGDALAAAAKLVKSNDEPKTLVAEFKKLEAPINAYFDSTMLMDENEKLRFARLSLAAAVGDILKTAGDWTQLVI